MRLSVAISLDLGVQSNLGTPPQTSYPTHSPLGAYAARNTCAQIRDIFSRYAHARTQHRVGLGVKMHEVEHTIEALVLAAGEGSRLRGCTKHKGLQPVAGIPLLGRVLWGLKQAGVKKVFVVVGYEGHSIRKEIGEDYRGLEISYITARDWERGNLYSFMAAKGIFQKEFLLCMGDHIFDPQLVKSLMKAKLEDVLVLATDKKCYSHDDTKVQERDGRILSIGKKLDSWNCIDTGFFFCSPNMFDYGAKAIEAGASELADCVRLVATNGYARVVDITGKRWVDVDTRRDIERAKELVAKHPKKRVP